MRIPSKASVEAARRVIALISNIEDEMPENEGLVVPGHEDKPLEYTVALAIEGDDPIACTECERLQASLEHIQNNASRGKADLCLEIQELQKIGEMYRDCTIDLRVMLTLIQMYVEESGGSKALPVSMIQDIKTVILETGKRTSKPPLPSPTTEGT